MALAPSAASGKGRGWASQVQVLHLRRREKTHGTALRERGRKGGKTGRQQLPGEGFSPSCVLSCGPSPSGCPRSLELNSCLQDATSFRRGSSLSAILVSVHMCLIQSRLLVCSGLLTRIVSGASAFQRSRPMRLFSSTPLSRTGFAFEYLALVCRFYLHVAMRVQCDSSTVPFYCPEPPRWSASVASVQPQDHGGIPSLAVKNLPPITERLSSRPYETGSLSALLSGIRLLGSALLTGVLVEIPLSKRHDPRCRRPAAPVTFLPRH